MLKIIANMLFGLVGFSQKFVDLSQIKNEVDQWLKLQF